MKITSFDRNTCRVISAAITSALKSVEAEYGVVITAGGGSYLDTNYTCKLKIACIGTNGEVKSKEVEDYKNMAKYYGLEPTDVGQTVDIGGRRIKIIGMKPRSYKFPVIGEDINCGKRYKFPIRSVQKAFGRKVTDPMGIFASVSDPFGEMGDDINPD